MTFFPDLCHTPARHPVHRPLLRRLLSALAWPWRQRQQRRHVVRLLDLDTRLLDDIGVTRTEVERAAYMAGAQSPPEELLRLSRLRRRREAHGMRH